MYVKVNPIATELQYGIHDELNARQVRIRQLFGGRTLVACVFKDDGPVRDGRARHADIPVSFVLPAQFDRLTWKMQLWGQLERIKRQGQN